ncbi:MAG: alpha/beta hydrolase [Actinomycetota bacterium]|nr:alpha/beta hydrolase [Actinomycetota bacterium]
MTSASAALTTAAGRPCVVMGHGFGATRDAGLRPFADRFAAVGADVLMFDYRGFGTSDGTPRQDVAHWRHRADYHSAIAYARSLPDVDPDRIVLWRSSYSGGHVLPVAVKDGRVAAVISQGAAMDGLAALLEIARYAGVVQLLKLTGHSIRDLARAVRGRPPHVVPIVGPAGSLAAITAEGAEMGYQAIMGPTFRNEMCARGIMFIPLNRPVTSASKLRCPLLVVLAERDNIAPTKSVRAAAKKAGRLAQVLVLPSGHFDIYAGEMFEKSVSAQVDFLMTHVPARHRQRAPG